MPARSGGLLDRWSDSTGYLKHDGRHTFQPFEIVAGRAREFRNDRNNVPVTTIEHLRPLRIEAGTAPARRDNAGDVRVQQNESNAGNLFVAISVRIPGRLMLSP